MTVDVVIGLQYGDEGKGKIVDWLSEWYDFVVRFNGGNNAGHTIVSDGKKIALHLVPSGILQRKICVIGNGVNINLEALVTELDLIHRTFGFDPRPFLYISERSHVIFEEDTDKSKVDSNSTGKGIRESYARKFYRAGVTIADLLDIPLFGRNDPRFSFKDMDKYARIAAGFKDRAVDVSLLLEEGRKKGQQILLEGAQGSGLDIDYGQYPFVTSSSCIAGGASIGAGIGPTKIDNVFGVAKVYTTRVDGNQESPFPTQLYGDGEKLLRDCGNEFGATTGRPRRCGWLDLVHLRQSIRVNGVEKLILTKLDVLDSLDEIKVCDSYVINGETTNEYPGTALRLRNAKPIYATFPGWKGQTTQGVTEFDKLPLNAKKYICFIGDRLGVDVMAISTGTERSHIIERN